jgi:hypothetical protein
MRQTNLYPQPDNFADNFADNVTNASTMHAY